MSKLVSSPEWRALVAHHEALSPAHLRDLFAADPQRFNRFSLRLDGLLFDYSKHRITQETLDLLVALARRADVEGWRRRMFAGEAINHTEGRAVLHDLEEVEVAVAARSVELESCRNVKLVSLYTSEPLSVATWSRIQRTS